MLAIGLGPFNLSLAALAHPLPDVEVEVVESRDAFVWHPGMMLPGAQIQVPFLADLVTFADPTSPYSFLAYLKAMGGCTASTSGVPGTRCGGSSRTTARGWQPSCPASPTRPR